MQAVDRELSRAQGALQALATSPYLVSADLAAFYVQANEVLRHEPGNNLVLIDARGQQLINTGHPIGAPLPRHGNPAQVHRVFETARPAISDLYFGTASRRPMISVDVPVMHDNRVVYDLSMGFFTDRLGAVLNRQRLPSGWPVAIFDSAGVTVAQTDQPERFIGKKGIPRLVQRMAEAGEGSFEEVTLEGIPAIVGFSRSAMSNWSVAIGVPRAVLTSELWTSVSWVLAGTMLLLMTGLDPACLCIEITEQLLLEDSEQNLATIAELKALGIRIAIDDFGVGYSSLSYIRRFHPAELKIDCSLTRDVADDPDDAALVRAAIAMAHSLKLRVVAEGVEPAAQEVFLQDEACDMAQGFLYARPQPTREFCEWLRRRRGV